MEILHPVHDTIEPELGAGLTLEQTVPNHARDRAIRGVILIEGLAHHADQAPAPPLSQPDAPVLGRRTQVDEQAAGSQHPVCFAEGMDHALAGHSSQGPGKNHAVELVRAVGQALGVADPVVYAPRLPGRDRGTGRADDACVGVERMDLRGSKLREAKGQTSVAAADLEHAQAAPARHAPERTQLPAGGIDRDRHGRAAKLWRDGVGVKLRVGTAPASPRRTGRATLGDMKAPDPLAPLRSEPWLTEARRKAIHLSFLVLPLALLFEPLPWPRGRAQWSILLIVLVAGAIAVDVLRVHERRVGSLFRALLGGLLREHERWSLLGSTYLLLAALLAVELFPQAIAAAALGFTVLGDAFAAMVGRGWGKPRFFGKSVEGALAGLVACLAWAAFLGWSGHLPWGVLLTGAVLASLIEFLPIPLDDNLGVTLFAGYAMKLLWSTG